jgi:hypothetical protein
MGHRQALVAYHLALIHKHVKFFGVRLGFSLDLDCEYLEDFGKYLRRTGRCHGQVSSSRRTTVIVLQLFHRSSQVPPLHPMLLQLQTFDFNFLA